MLDALVPVAKLVVSQQDENYNHVIRCCDAYVKAVKILCKTPVVDEGEGDVAIDMDHPQYEGLLRQDAAEFQKHADIVNRRGRRGLRPRGDAAGPCRRCAPAAHARRTR